MNNFEAIKGMNPEQLATFLAIVKDPRCSRLGRLSEYYLDYLNKSDGEAIVDNLNYIIENIHYSSKYVGSDMMYKYFPL